MENFRIPLSQEFKLDGVRGSIANILTPILDKFYYIDSTLLGDYYEGYYGLEIGVEELLFIEFPLIADLGLVIGD